MTQISRRRMMERKIVEMLVAGTGVNQIAGQLHVSKSRIRRLRELAKQYRYLDDAGQPGQVRLPSYPEAIDGTSKKTLAVKVSAGLGFEPRLSGPEPLVLPLHHPARC